ncbi:MAG TPA: DUF433 domain-containing protein [Pyrinomonadaceae bacterium]|nr:DUF433 domain-containing protein [Acidobacteriota bacterium]HQZ98417.1 DUF433 domain-containing protein [Pyrinomonadaceae bacterium]
MNTVEALKQTEIAIARLSDADRRRLFRKFARGYDGGIEKKDGVMGGAACIRNTRIPVWLLHQARVLGMSEGDLLKSYPGLTAEDLVNAWDYVNLNLEEIESQIARNESDD